MSAAEGFTQTPPGAVLLTVEIHIIEQNCKSNSCTSCGTGTDKRFALNALYSLQKAKLPNATGLNAYNAEPRL
jgi:hypothetical protein